MKRFFSAIISTILIFSIIASLVSCNDDTSGSQKSESIPSVIPVTTAPSESGTTSATKPVSGEIKSSSGASSDTTADADSVEEEKPDAELQALLEKKLDAMNFNGVVRVSKDGKLVCEAANGKMSSSSNKDIKTDTLFAIASCSKQFTAAAIMILKQDGKLKVSDTIDKYFPKYRYGEDITIKNLLTMRSGISDFLNEISSFSKYDPSKNASEKKNRDITRNWIFKQDLKFTPDGLYDYSNSNYFLLAEIVEKVSGKSFGEFLKERIFKPLGMNNTDVNENLAYSDKLALSDPDPNDLRGIKSQNTPLTIRVKGLNVGNGGLISTAADMDRWLTSLREYTVLTKESVKEMTTDYNPLADHYGYGVQITSDGACWHVGALDYYASYSYTIPKKGYNFFAVTNDKNTMTCDIYTFAAEIMNSTK